jgi:hypothetical protein
MAMQSGALAAAVAEPAPLTLASLPDAMLLEVLSRVPVDSRLCCAAVCRAWRAVLDERSVWLRLDLSASGVSPKREATDALLHAAVARARGELVALDISGCKHVTFDALLAAVTANGALRELRTSSLWGRDDERSVPLNTDELEPLLRAAPRLAVFEADVWCRELALAHRLLRNSAAFAPLRVHSFAFEYAWREGDAAAVLELAAHTASHAHLRRLELTFAPLNTAAALDAVVDAALMRRLTSVMLGWCNLLPASAPALVRLIGGARWRSWTYFLTTGSCWTLRLRLLWATRCARAARSPRCRCA